METTGFSLEEYLNEGVEKVVKSLIKGGIFHPRQSMYIAKFALSCKKAAELRKSSEIHIPPFLIASITSMCNLHCAGCYARSLEACEDGEPVDQLTDNEWGKVFKEATELGISFILLAGGEPLVRRDVIEKAAEFPEILFPVFTNGTMINDSYIGLFDKNRNVVPILSIEGGLFETDTRRGKGVYSKINAAMERLNEKRIAFGASITVTSKNMMSVTSDEFVKGLIDSGCKALIYVEFVPTDESLSSLVLDDEQKEYMARRVSELRRRDEALLVISFPGDEKYSEGCLAAGRGFFHISSHGGAESCPFSPYSDMNIKNCSLKEALASPLFRALREEGILTEEHDGGCVLYQKRAEVEALLNK